MAKLKVPLAKQTIQIRHPFSDEELLEKAQELCVVTRGIAALESQKSAAAKDYGSRIEMKEDERDSLTTKIQSKSEMRDILAYLVMDDPKNGKKSFYRVDDNGDLGAFIETRDMTHADLQMSLPNTEVA